MNVVDYSEHIEQIVDMKIGLIPSIDNTDRIITMNVTSDEILYPYHNEGGVLVPSLIFIFQ